MQFVPSEEEIEARKRARKALLWKHYRENQPLNKHEFYPTRFAERRIRASLTIPFGRSIEDDEHKPDCADELVGLVRNEWTGYIDPEVWVSGGWVEPNREPKVRGIRPPVPLQRGRNAKFSERTKRFWRDLARDRPELFSLKDWSPFFEETRPEAMVNFCELESLWEDWDQRQRSNEYLLSHQRRNTPHSLVDWTTLSLEDSLLRDGADPVMLDDLPVELSLPLAKKWIASEFRRRPLPTEELGTFLSGYHSRDSFASAWFQRDPVRFCSEAPEVLEAEDFGF